MMPLRRRWSLLFVLLVVAPLCRVQAEEAAKVKADQGFLRFDEDDNGGGRLQTAIHTYKNADGVVVHLVGAIHIADPKYFEGLQKTFTGYDALLYEMVKPKNAAPPGGGNAAHSTSIISTIQRTLKDFLDLDFQLDDIDYSAKNFVHADLDAETFEKMQSDRGENMLTLMLKQIMREMSKPAKEDNAEEDDQMDPLEILHALTSPNRSRDLKLLLARNFENMEDQVSALQGDDGTVILTERNKAAMKVLKDQIKAGNKNIGVFYGAAHMKDLSKQVKDMGFKETDVEWRTAWDLPIKAKHHKKHVEEKAE